MRTALLAFLMISPVVAHAADDVWREIKSPHFTVISNGKEKEAQGLAQEFEKIRVVYSASLPGQTDPAVPVVVYALKRDRDFRDLFPGFGAYTAGFFRNDGTQITIVLKLDEEEYRTRIAYHEYHHLLLERSAPHTPTWLSEGLAELWGAAKIKGRDVEVARLDYPQLAYARDKPLIPLARLLQVTRRSPEYSEWGESGMFYAQSTFLTHMLILKEPDGERKLRKFVEMLGQGIPAEHAMAKTFGDVKDVEERLVRYLRNQSFPLVKSRLTEAAAVVAVSTRVLSPVEVNVALGEVLARRNPELAKPKLRAALDAEPGNTRALTAMAFVGTIREGRPWLLSAVARPDAGFDTHWYAASFLGVGTDGDPAVVESHLARAIALNPGFAPPYPRLAHIRAKSNPAEAVELAMKAVRLEPGNPVYLVRAAKIVRATGNKAEAGRLGTEAMLRALRFGANASNEVCWNGALAGLADVVFAACENGVSREPEDPSIRDSRGLARAMTGDKAGAIEDFEFAIAKNTKDPKFVETRTAWVEALRAGKNPFDAATLAKLDAWN